MCMYGGPHRSENDAIKIVEVILGINLFECNNFHGSSFWSTYNMVQTTLIHNFIVFRFFLHLLGYYADFCCLFKAHRNMIWDPLSTYCLINNTNMCLLKRNNTLLLMILNRYKFILLNCLCRVDFNAQDSDTRTKLTSSKFSVYI